MSISVVSPVRGFTLNSRPSFDWTSTSQPPRAAMPFALKPAEYERSPVSAMVVAAVGAGQRAAVRPAG